MRARAAACAVRRAVTLSLLTRRLAWLGVAVCLTLLALPVTSLVAHAQTGETPRPPPATAGEARERVREASRGMASWYGMAFSGKRTASGEPFDPAGMTAAHRTLPFGTVVEVRSLVNGRTVRVRINDRGPLLPNRVIDLSEAAARELGLRGRGTKLVELRVVESAPPARAAVSLRPR